MEIRRVTSLRPSIGKETYAQLRRRLEWVIKWLVRTIPNMTDQKLRPTRIYYYKNQIQKIERLHREGQTDQLSKKDFENYIGSLHDAYLLCDLHREYRGRRDRAFVSALEEIIDGTPQVKDERNSKSRDTLFELRTAGLFGSQYVSFDVEDFVVNVDGKKLGVECKRLKSDKQSAVERNFKDARSQLRKKLDAGIINVGMVAFEIDKIFNIGDKALLAPDSRRIGDTAGRYIDDFLNRNRKIFLNQTDTRIIGILAILISPAISDREKIPFYVIMSGLNNLCISEDSIADNGKHYIDPNYYLLKEVIKMLTSKNF